MEVQQVKERTLSNELQTNPLKVNDLLNQLVVYTENLSDKMNQIKEKHQSDFLVAYKNHMVKIKKDLLDLKHQSEQHEKQMFQNDKIINTEKELMFFRDECMKLYQKLDIKNKENYELKFKMQELEQDKQHLEQQTKSLMKRMRHQEINQTSDFDSTNNHKPLLDQTFCTSTQHRISKFKRKMTECNQKLEPLINSVHYSQIKEMLEADFNKDTLLDEITNYIKNIENRYQSQIKLCKQKIASLICTSNKANIIRSDLEHFFLDCVETIRREILKKKLPNHQQQMQIYMDSIKDYQIFHKEDKIKLLELVLSNEKLLVFLYQKIFPNHLSVVLQQAKEESIQVNNTTIKKRQSSFEAPKTTREIRSYSSKYQQLEVKKGKLLFKQF